MRFFQMIVLGLLLGANGWAQEDQVTTATSALQDVLSTLKDSVQKLSLDNDQLAARDKAIKTQVLQLQMQLGQLQQQEGPLNKAVAKLQDKNPGRAQAIIRLGEENDDLDNRTQKAQDSIKLIQLGLDAGYQENQKLLLQLKGMQGNSVQIPSVESPESQLAARHQKEKLKLMKMIYDSQQRQELLHTSIMDYQKNTTLLPVAGAWAHQEILKEQIKDLESQLTSYPQEKTSEYPEYSNPWDNNELGQMEEELKDLEKNYSQLKSLVQQMDKKVQNTRMSVSQHVEEEKLQGSIHDLNHQALGLRVNLDDLRSQMVDLDKRKSHLEEMIRQLQ